MNSSENSLRVMTNSSTETEQWGERLSALLRPADVIAFYGDLGAGKTTFVRGLARAAGATECVSSPTFVLMHIYEGRFPVYHFDAYRLQNSQELLNIGAEEYIGTDGVACIEWSERTEELLPDDCLRIKIYYRTDLGPEGRELVFESNSGRGKEIVEALKRDS
ncbi:MAG: tRNA (adenosine(37)-N6)-threonylcarbamoyltransferase complex ATPase subunit type 1 TsaE [Candidatus Bruticola sp.]